MLGSDVSDPGMVNEGTKCGVDEVRRRTGGGGGGGDEDELIVSPCIQVCMNFECRSVEVLNYDCDMKKKCHGHGVRPDRNLSVRCVR